MWTTPEKHTKRRVGNANQNKTTKRAGYKKVYENPPKEAFRIKGAWWNTGQNKNSNSNSETEEGKRKSPKMKHSNWKGALKNHSEKNRAYKMLKETTKPLRRRVLIEESLAKSSKNKYKKSTWRTQTSGIFVKQVVFHTVNHCGPLPLKELHSTSETIVWRDPGGSWACLPPV